MAESVRERLRACLVDGSKADRALASYILAKIGTIPFETAATLAAKVSVSEPTVGRFCRTLGYQSFKDLKAQLRADLGDRPWLIADRLQDFHARAQSGENQLALALEQEIAGLVAVYELAQTEEWRRVARRLATARRVFVAGFQTERGMADIFAHSLQYLRDGVQLLDLAGGNFAELLASDPAGVCLVLFEARRYSRLARLLARKAAGLGLPVTLITDAYRDWSQDGVAEAFIVPTEFNLFWDSTALMASLTNLMMNTVSIEIGPSVEARMNRVSSLYNQFIGHLDDSDGPED